MVAVDDDDESKTSSGSERYDDNHTPGQQGGRHVSRSSITSSSSASLSNGGAKRHKDVSPCYVCGAKAHGYNFDQSNFITPPRCRERCIRTTFAF